jgi:hypothetical protein
MDDFKKQLEELAKQEKEKQVRLKQAREEFEAEMKRIGEDSKRIFSEAVQNVIVPFEKEMHDVFKKQGVANVKIYTNYMSNNLEDSIRNFAQILYYPPGKSPQMVGLNTQSILFELLKDQGKVLIKQQLKGGHSLQELVGDIGINKFDEALIKKSIINFLNLVILTKP